MSDLQPWIIAYKKMKVDLFYSSGYDMSDELLEYEKDLEANLNRVSDFVNNYKKKDSSSNTFDELEENLAGDLLLCGKSYNPDENAGKYEFRFMAKPSLNFHLIGSYWINNVGEHLDRKLDDRYIYANRVRRNKDKGVNKLALGNFEYYVPKYIKWQTNAMDIIQKELESERKVSVFILDAKDYYYNICPDSIRRYQWVKDIIANLNKESKTINELFFDMLDLWGTKLGSPEGPKLGIPVGPSASAIIANIALLEFDNLVLDTIHPLYYGRYVDDIIIVCGDNGKIGSTDDLFKKLKNNSKNKKDLIKIRSEDNIVVEVLEEYEITFNQDKIKSFTFDKDNGKVQLEILQKSFGERTSEWRALPNLPAAKEIETSLLKITSKVELEKYLRLKDVESPVPIKNRFIFMLRDCEIYARTFAPYVWKDKLRMFVKTFSDHMVTKEQLFKFENYLQRVVFLVLLLETYDELIELLVKLNKTVGEIVSEQEEFKLKGIKVVKENLILYNEYILNLIESAFWKTNPSIDVDKIKRGYESQVNSGDDKLNLVDFFSRFAGDEKTVSLKDKYNQYFLRDLAIFPLKTLITTANISPLTHYNFGKELRTKFAPEDNFPQIIENILLTKNYNSKNDRLDVSVPDMIDDGFKENYHSYFKFLTRPIGEYDMFFNAQYRPYSETSTFYEQFKDSLVFFRGYEQGDPKEKDIFIAETNTVELPYKDINTEKINIALACFPMEEMKLEHILSKTKDDTLLKRYEEFTGLINNILSYKGKIDYVVLPELSIPLNWFVNAANKLQKKEINLIGGVEYLIGDGKVSNEVWACLRHSLFEYNSYMLVKQDKQFPASNEEVMLNKFENLQWNYSSKKNIEDDKRWPPIIRHGDFFFSMLVCAELLNINYRNSLRGKIECLFVPEWNRDINTFNDLINSTSLDLHSFIVQVNNNKYGDNRIRAPFKDNYKKDVVKAKGGKNNYFIVGTINAKELRSSHSKLSTLNSFKPLPIGFEMSEDRSSLNSN